MLRNTVLGLGFALALTVPAAAQTVDELIAKNLEAKGGLDKIKAVQSLRLTARMTVGPGMEAPATIELKRPNKMRLDVVIQGMTLTQAYDGKAGWQINPFQGNPNAEPMSPEDLQDAEENGDMDGPLVDYKAKGHQVELVGKEKLEGTETYKLKLTRKTGKLEYIYLDSESYLEIKGESKKTVRGTEEEAEQTIGDYKEVGGILYPHALEGGPKGRPERQKITIEKVEQNPALDDARFAMPAKKDAPPAAPKK